MVTKFGTVKEFSERGWKVTLTQFDGEEKVTVVVRHQRGYAEGTFVCPDPQTAICCAGKFLKVTAEQERKYPHSTSLAVFAVAKDEFRIIRNCVETPNR